MLVFPSPKFHTQPVISLEPAELKSENVTVKLSAENAKLADGPICRFSIVITESECVSVKEFASVTTRLTIKVSAVANSWTGFCTVLEFPSPKFQYQNVIIQSPESDASVNCIVKYEPE